MATISLSKALNNGLRQAMERDPKVVLMGEDIGKLGGVFRVTEGLQRDFGERRVIDTPLAESGVVGTAVGLALRGYRPVCEIQFDGFIYPAFDQIVSQVAKMRYRNEGRVSVPLTIRVPFGGGVGAVEHHSESPEAYFAHTAGLRVVTPSNAADGYRMIQQSIASDDPGRRRRALRHSSAPRRRPHRRQRRDHCCLRTHGGHGAPSGAHRARGGNLH
jgi:2-oxoisovalerate dehydrogenase E1 component beta subunit